MKKYSFLIISIISMVTLYHPTQASDFELTAEELAQIAALEELEKIRLKEEQAMLEAQFAQAIAESTNYQQPTYNEDDALEQALKESARLQQQRACMASGTLYTITPEQEREMLIKALIDSNPDATPAEILKMLKTLGLETQDAPQTKPARKVGPPVAPRPTKVKQ